LAADGSGELMETPAKRFQAKTASNKQHRRAPEFRRDPRAGAGNGAYGNAAGNAGRWNLTLC
jgi:hypothetical protein